MLGRTICSELFRDEEFFFGLGYSIVVAVLLLSISPGARLDSPVFLGRRAGPADTCSVYVYIYLFQWRMRGRVSVCVCV